MSASAPAKPATPEALLRRLEWKVLRRLDGILHGDYRTLFRGSGVDLADLREYVHEDDVRHIDWNVTARMQTPYVRVYNEERDLTAWFLLDLSPSTDFGSRELQKSSIELDLVAVLARMLTQHGNRVGAMMYGGHVDKIIPARSGRRHVLHIMHGMQTHPHLPQSDPTSLNELLTAALNTIPRRSLVFLVSDFISQPGWDKPLAQLAQRHEVIAVRLYDEMEMRLPDLGLFVIQDAESGEQLFVDTHDRVFRERFTAIATQREEALHDALGRAGVDALELATDDDLVEVILRFADLRKRRTLLASGGNLPSHLSPRQPPSHAGGQA
jgi:uncharacterized protein (DUF58 family)